MKSKANETKTEPASAEPGEKSHDALIEEIQEDEEDLKCTGSLYRMSIVNGKLEFQMECEVPSLPIPASKLDSSAVFVADIGIKCFIWIGKGVDKVISQNGMIIAHHYLQKTSHPLIPACIVRDGRETKDFKKVVRN